MRDESEKEPELKIVDKRRFSTEGAKENSPEPSIKQDPRAGTETKRAEPEPVVSKPVSKTGSSQKGQQESDSGRGEQGPTAGGGQPRVDFASFVMSLATQTLMMLGEIPNPETKLTSMNLGAARQTIDILDMLEIKTQGNLSAEEKRLFVELLPSLRMVFVEKVRGGVDVKL